MARVPAPAGAGLDAIVTRMAAIAADSADRMLLADGPPHPDAELLALPQLRATLWPADVRAGG